MMLIFIIIFVSLYAFWPVFGAGFLQFDDPQHIFSNPAVQATLPDSLGLIFTQSVNKIYMPLTTLSFALEHHVFGFNPFVFHLDNMLLHLGVALAAFFFLKRLGIKPHAAFFAMVIFAVHPMKAESVAWATERKDMLYALFYVLSLLAYTAYLRHYARRSFWLSVLFALLSTLSKPMAISLPLILFLLDWYHRRAFTFRLCAEKIPFAFIAGSIGWITYAQNMRNPIADLGTSILVWIWSFCFYIWKFFLPVHVYPFYKLPVPVSLDRWEYSASLALFLALLLSLWVWRRRRLLVFAAGFYLLSIFFLLRFDIGVDASVVNDRFMYLPGLGFCLLLGILCARLWHSRIGKLVVICSLLLLTLKTHAQCRIWTNTLSFYTEVIRAYPDAFTGYINRAHYYYQTGQLEAALADYNKALALNPGFARIYIGRGTIYGLQNNARKAWDDFNTAVSLDGALAEGYFNRAIAGHRLGMTQEAFQDLQKAKQLGIPAPPEFLEKLKNALTRPPL